MKATVANMNKVIKSLRSEQADGLDMARMKIIEKAANSIEAFIS